jgi:hypothetical protein
MSQSAEISMCDGSAFLALILALACDEVQFLHEVTNSSVGFELEDFSGRSTCAEDVGLVTADVAGQRFDMLCVDELNVPARRADTISSDGGLGGPSSAVEVVLVFGEGKPGVSTNGGMFFDELEGPRRGGRGWIEL